AMAAGEDPWARRQLDEVASLRAIFFEEGAVSVEEAALSALEDFALGQERGRPPAAPPPLALSVRAYAAGAAAVRLAAVLPHGYPRACCDGPL
ncbi:unnamed protein product, partial [Prorocentrum cordatum]